MSLATLKGIQRAIIISPSILNKKCAHKKEKWEKQGPLTTTRRNNINQKHTMAKWFLIKRNMMKNDFLIKRGFLLKDLSSIQYLLICDLYLEIFNKIPVMFERGLGNILDMTISA